MKKLISGTIVSIVLLSTVAASAEDIKIALLAGRTGPLEAYAKQTETGEGNRRLHPATLCRRTA